MVYKEDNLAWVVCDLCGDGYGSCNRSLEECVKVHKKMGWKVGKIVICSECRERIRNNSHSKMRFITKPVDRIKDWHRELPFRHPDLPLWIAVIALVCSTGFQVLNAILGIGPWVNSP